MAHLPNVALDQGPTARSQRANVRRGPLRLLAAIAEEANGSLAPAAHDDLGSARQLLFRRAGDRALELPVAAGQAAVRLEALLAEGPTAIDPGVVDAAHAWAAATMVLSAADVLLRALGEEAAVLGEVLFSDLDGLTIEELDEVAAAVRGLGLGVRPVTGWGTRADASAAERILRLAAHDLRAAASSHRLLYERFTEGVWLVPDALLEAGRRRWRVCNRARLRRRLRESSRTGGLPGPLTAVARQILEVRVDRDRLEALSGLRAEHLEHLDRGPLTDVDAVLTGLGAVRRLQVALGGALDEGRLCRLLLADAFHSPDVQGPAAAVRSAIGAWSEEVVATGGAAAGGLRLAEITVWAEECRAGMPVLDDAIEAAASSGMDAPSLRRLVDALLLREYIEQRVDAQGCSDRSLGARSAS